MKKRVKAWVVIDDWDSESGKRMLDVAVTFPLKTFPIFWVRSYANEVCGRYSKVVPCTITFDAPKRKRRVFK